MKSRSLRGKERMLEARRKNINYCRNRNGADLILQDDQKDYLPCRTLLLQRDADILPIVRWGLRSFFLDLGGFATEAEVT